MARRENMIVTSLIQYAKDVALSDGTRFYTRTTNYMPIFRGQANASWPIEPSVYRNSCFKNEANYIREIERIEPESFGGLSYIEKLMKMQHYGLPTRLIDFTTNALIALYFACNSEPLKDGVVYELHALPLYRQEFVWISIVMKYIFEFSNMPFSIDLFIKEIQNNLNDYPTRGVENFDNEDEIIRILTSPLGVYPKLSNQRLRCQEGVFVLFGMKIKEHTNRCFEFCEGNYLSIQDLWPESRTIIIPADSKAQILHELDLIGFNRRKLFPELESQIQYATKYVDKQNL